MMNSNQNGIYLGLRGESFKALIISILKKADLKDKYIKALTSVDAMKVYGTAFTSDTVDPDDNYQVLEQLGDLSGNKFIVSYMYKRFPQLKCNEGVSVVARLRINYGAKNSFCEIARKLGFWNYITATNELRSTKMKSLLEDVFEAFLGATEQIMDEYKSVGVGYAVVYKILCSIFNDMEISLKYTDLYDAKTLLKELFDIHGDVLGPIVYKDEKIGAITHSSVFRVMNAKYKEIYQGPNKPVRYDKKRILSGKYIEIGKGSSGLQNDSRQIASKNALYNLKKQGYSKPTPFVYRKFENNSDTVETTKKQIVEKWGDDPLVLQRTKDNTRYGNNYRSTPLALYCRKRDIKGVKYCLGMDKTNSVCNVVDSDGMYPLDLLLIGHVDEQGVKNIVSMLMENDSCIKLHRQILDTYYNQYVSEFFIELLEKLTIVD